MDLEIQGVGLITLIMGLTELAKQFGFPNRLLPLLDIVLGLIGGFLTQQDTLSSVIVGLMLGTSAAGVYRAVKVTALGR